MGALDFFTWRSQTAANMPAVADEDLVADVDEPPDHQSPTEPHHPDFHKSHIRTIQGDRKESLLTKALLRSPDADTPKPIVHVDTDPSRRRSIISNASQASTAELTSDGGLTSPARTNTPSPPFPATMYTSFGPISSNTKTNPATVPSMTIDDVMEPVTAPVADTVVMPEPAPVAAAAPKKRCISFACGGRKEAAAKPPTPPVAATVAVEAPKRICKIQFACPGPKPSETPAKDETRKIEQATKIAENSSSSGNTVSPSAKKTRPLSSPNTRLHRDSASTVRRASRSPLAVRSKPKYVVASEDAPLGSEATRFHEFASEKLEEDDWIRKDSENPRARLTIDDTLQKENAIRRLGNEVEEEALDDSEEEETAEDEQDSDDSDEDESNDEVDDDVSAIDSDDQASDGNETDNEAGFAESDDESDTEGDFAFWTPGRKIPGHRVNEASTYRPSAHRTASASSIESLINTEPLPDTREKADRAKGTRRIKIMRPGTPDLPDSTDFVCGTLDEDRPLEDAYVSCMEARKREHHRARPQDIDPSFPTSDPENEEDEVDEAAAAVDSDEHVWLLGKFEEDEEDHPDRRRSTVLLSPKRLQSPPPPRRYHSPPPAKHRLRSPPPRKLFGGHSPRRARSPPPARTIRSPAASPTQVPAGAINFAPLGSRPGLTHTKSLPRATNVFSQAYRTSRIAAENECGISESDADVHVRGAIDIVKGLEQKRQRRREKFFQKQCGRNRKGHCERKPQPGKGAERMRELGLLMAGKTGPHDPYMMSA